MANLLIIACPRCDQLNRLPKEKLSAGGKCGSCKKALISNTPIPLNLQSFRNQVIKNDLPVLVDFWAPWCGPCKAMSVVLEDAAKKQPSNIKIAKVNTEEEQLLASKFNIRNIPTLIIFHKEKEVDRVAGAMSAVQLNQWINNSLTKHNIKG